MLYLRRTFDYEHPPEEADIALIGVPFDSTKTGKSIKYGPLFIREALKNLHGYEPETGKNPFTRYKPCDLGDVEAVPGSWKLTAERIGDTVKSVFEVNPKILPIFLGGEHLISLGILQSISGLIKNKITVIHFDAHRDLVKDWMGAGYSHITWARRLLESGSFELVQLGARSWTEEEEAAVKKFAVKSTIQKTQNPVYVTVDMDVFDPSFGPEVGTPEPLGISPKDFFSQLKTACGNKIIGLDIVECASDRVNSPTAVLAAQIIKKFLCYL